MSDYTATVMKMAIHRKCDNPAYADGVTYIEIVDEAAGAFLELSQGDQKIRIDPEELELILTEAQRMLAGYPEDAPEHPWCGDGPR